MGIFPVMPWRFGGRIVSNWDELVRAIRTPDDSVLRVADDADLDAFETDRGMKLPTSYREFAKQFGRCTLGSGCHEFAIPSVADGDGSRYDLTAFDRQMHGIAVAGIGPSWGTKTPEIATGLVFFSSDEGGDAYGWYPHEVTDAVGNEYAIYGRFDETYKRVASSFAEFVMVHCLGEDLSNWREDEEAQIFLEPN